MISSIELDGRLAASSESQISTPRLLEEKYQLKFKKFNQKEGYRLLGIKAEHKVRKKKKANRGWAGGLRGRQGGAPGKEGGRLTRGRYTLDRRHTPYNRCNWDQVPQRGPAPSVSPRSTPDEGIRADPGAESGSSTALKTGASAGGGRGGGRSLMMLSQPGRPGRTA